MTRVEAREHFGNDAAIAKALGITKGAVSQWGDAIPESRQLQIHRITKGRLKADPAILSKYREILRAA